MTRTERELLAVLAVAHRNLDQAGVRRRPVHIAAPQNGTASSERAGGPHVPPGVRTAADLTTSTTTKGNP